MPKSIAVISGKGGTGKTTIAVNLATTLALLGENTLLVDANLKAPHVGFHFSNGIYKTHLHEVLNKKAAYSQAINYDISGLKIVPGNPLAQEQTWNYEGLRHYSKAADYVIFDCPPENHREVLNHVDQAIIVTEAQLPALMEAQKAILELRKKHKVLAGVVLNKLGKHELNSEQAERFIGMIAVSKLRHDIGVANAVHEQEPYVRLYPKKDFSKQIQELASRLANKPL